MRNTQLFVLDPVPVSIITKTFNKFTSSDYNWKHWKKCLAELFSITVIFSIGEVGNEICCMTVLWWWRPGAGTSRGPAELAAAHSTSSH